MSEQFTPEVREALWRCYELILTYGRQQEQDEGGQESEDAAKVGDQTASPGTSTVEVEYASSLPAPTYESMGEGVLGD